MRTKIKPVLTVMNDESQVDSVIFDSSMLCQIQMICSCDGRRNDYNDSKLFYGSRES